MTQMTLIHTDLYCMFLIGVNPCYLCHPRSPKLRLQSIRIQSLKEDFIQPKYKLPVFGTPIAKYQGDILEPLLNGREHQ